LAALAACSTPDVGGSASLAYKSEAVLGKGFMPLQGPALEGEAALEYQDVRAGGWVLYGLHDQETEKQDAFLRYARNLGKDTPPPADDWILGAGFTNQTFPGIGLEDIPELSASITAPLPLHPTVTGALGDNAGGGRYAEFSLREDVDLGLPLVLRAKVGYNDDYIREGTGFSHAVAGAGFRIPLRTGAWLAIEAAYQEALDDDFRDQFWSSVGLQAAF
ncbi:MAG: hypothetical protein HY520_01985, partial [Candidatus Aenigmarchaeota archaeon]|nr:hypothetical protein [Candidatus Aenigmarchaeota archaeon]